MNTLIFTHSEPKYLPPVILSPDETICGPWYTNLKTDGRYRYRHTLGGIFDASDTLADIRPQDKPDLILVHADSTGGCVPRNLPNHCTKVLLVGDTHHLSFPIQKLVNYASIEPFDAIVVWNRQHAHFFTELGLSNVFWMPGLLFSIPETATAPARTEDISFFGQLNDKHSRRLRILKAVMGAGHQVAGGFLSRRESLELAAKSTAALNVSLNGDLNLRIFEVTQNGALLYTDQLSHFSGLHHFYNDGENIAIYNSIEELLSKIKYYSNHPAEGSRIAGAGQKVTEQHFSLQTRSSDFLNLLNNGNCYEAFQLRDEPRCRIRSSTPENKAATLRRIQIYEIIQEIHRTNDAPKVVLTSSVSPFIAIDLADLVRLKQQIVAGPQNYENHIQPLISKMGVRNLTRMDPDAFDSCQVDVCITKREELPTLLPQIRGSKTKVCIWDFDTEDRSLTQTMKSNGFNEPNESTPGLFNPVSIDTNFDISQENEGSSINHTGALSETAAS